MGYHLFLFLWSLRFGARYGYRCRVVSSSRAALLFVKIEQAQLYLRNFCENVCVPCHYKLFPYFLQGVS